MQTLRALDGFFAGEDSRRYNRGSSTRPARLATGKGKLVLYVTGEFFHAPGAPCDFERRMPAL